MPNKATRRCSGGRSQSTTPKKPSSYPFRWWFLRYAARKRGDSTPGKTRETPLGLGGRSVNIEAVDYSPASTGFRPREQKIFGGGLAPCREEGGKRRVSSCPLLSSTGPAEDYFPLPRKERILARDLPGLFVRRVKAPRVPFSYVLVQVTGQHQTGCQRLECEPPFILVGYPSKE